MVDNKELKQLKKQIDIQEKEINILVNNWALELKEISSKSGFKTNSKKGEKLLDKLAEKYAPLINEAEYVRDELQEKYNDIIDNKR